MEVVCSEVDRVGGRRSVRVVFASVERLEGTCQGLHVGDVAAKADDRLVVEREEAMDVVEACE